MSHNHSFAMVSEAKEYTDTLRKTLRSDDLLATVSQVLPDMYRDLIDASLMDKYRAFETKDFVSSCKELMPCPAKNCDNVVRCAALAPY